MKKPVIEYEPSGPSGNIYCILGELSKIMQKQGRLIAFNELRDRVFAAHSYEEAMKIISEEATLKAI